MRRMFFEEVPSELLAFWWGERSDEASLLAEGGTECRSMGKEEDPRADSRVSVADRRGP